MTCAELFRTQAYLDGEADPANAPEIERHLESCAECAAQRDAIEAARAALRRDATYFRADSALRRQLDLALDREDIGNAPHRGWFANIALHTRQFWSGAASGAFATAAAAALAFFLLIPPPPNQLVNDALSAHLRSLMASHLVDVVSSNHHTVKPWFAGHADVSPPVADFASEGYQLIGGRIDYLDGRRAAVTVYRHGAHIINIFAWAYRGESLPNPTTRNGYHIVFWKSGNLAFCAISDTALDELLVLTRLLKATATPDSRE